MVDGDDPIPPIIDPTVERTCTNTDGSLRLCIDFEDPSMNATDGSGKGHHPVLLEGLTTNSRDNVLGIIEQAAELSTGSKIQIAEHVDLDIPTNLTVSLWVNSPTRPTANNSYWLVDNNNQYSMSIQSDGKVRCGLGTTTIDSATIVNIGGSGWHHLACTYDGTRLKVYIDGYLAGCDNNVGRAIATTGAEGLSIGSNIGASPTGPVFNDRFVGGLDNVQVFARTWSGSELCSAAGQSGCTNFCPLFGQSGGGDDNHGGQGGGGGPF